MLSNFDPATPDDGAGPDGSLKDRSTHQPRHATTSGRAWASPGRRSTAPSVRGGYGVSYVHFHRAGGANVLPINGPQVINAVVVQTPTQSRLPDDRAGLSGRPDRSVAVQPAGRQHHLHARGLPLEPGAELVRVGAARARPTGCSSTWPTSATAPTACCCSPTSTRPRPNNAAGTIPLQQRRPIPEFADITYSFNGGKSRYHAFQGKLDWRVARALTFMTSLTLSQTKDNGAGSLESPNGNFPAPQDFRNLDADFGLSGYHQPYNSTTSVVWDLPVRPRPPLHGRRAAGRRPAARRLAAGRREHDRRRARRSRCATTRRRRSRCRASSRTSAAPTTTGPTSPATCWRPRAAGRRRTT